MTWHLTTPQALTLEAASSNGPWLYPMGQQRLINAALVRRGLMNDDCSPTYMGWMIGRAVAQHLPSDDGL